MSKEGTIRLTALGVSLIVHAALFVQLSDASMHGQAQAPRIDSRISLNLLAPPEKTPPQEVAELIPPKPKPKRKPKPELRKKISRPKPKPVTPVVQEQAVAPKLAKAVQRHEGVDPAPIRQHYLTQLLTYIEGYKYYPHKARRRGMEGSIQVSFELLPNGNINGLVTSGGPLLLRRAAKGAVHKALPLPACPPELKCPMQVSYAMQFLLR